MAVAGLSNGGSREAPGEGEEVPTQSHRAGRVCKPMSDLFRAVAQEAAVRRKRT